MLREVSDIELGLWFADVRMGTVADEKENLRVAVLASASMNGPHFLKTDKKPYSVRDFLPQDEKPNVADQLKAILLPRMKKEN